MNNTINTEAYEEIPVSIDEFLDSERYLGKFTDKGNMIYPTVRQKLNELFADDTKYVNVSLTGGAGTGKTTVTVLGTAYLLYKLLCLKNSQEYWGFPQDNKISIVFYNTLQHLAMGTAYELLHKILCESPWFLEHGTVLTEGNIVTFEPGKNIVIDTAISATGTFGKQVYAVILDECDYDKTKISEDELQAELLKVYSSLEARVKSRFTREGNVFGMLFAISADSNANNIVTDKYLKDKSDTFAINLSKSDN